MSDARMPRVEGSGQMGVTDYLPGLGTDREPVTYHECRACGRTLEDAAECCPDCEGDVVTYEL